VICRTWYSRYEVGVDVASRVADATMAIGLHSLEVARCADSTEHGTRYPVSQENCRKRIRLRRHLFRRSSTSELPSFAALAVHAMSRLGRSRSLLRTVAAVEPAIPSSLSHGWGQVRLSRTLAPSSSTARSKERTRDGRPLRVRICSHPYLRPQ
jgi:hypothetical protein